MKKLMIMLVSALLLTSCSQVRQEEASFSLTDEQISAYKEQISTALKASSWGFNPDTVSFSQGTIPGESDETYADIAFASADMGFDISSYAGDEAVVASVVLQHINGRDAGTAYFCFENETPVCEYYVYKDRYYSLNSKNPFERGDLLTAYEDTSKAGSFNEENISASLTDVYAVSGTVIGTITDSMAVYYDCANDFGLVSSQDFASEGLKPLDMTLGEDYGAVLLGEEAEVDTAEEIHDDSANPEKEIPAKSVFLAITDNRGSFTGERIPLEVSTYTSVTQLDGRLILSRDKSLDEFSYSDGVLTKENTYNLGHYIDRLAIADIDGNGSDEYIASDGTNIYVYSKDSTFELIWRTNMQLNSLEGNIYAADLNGDGVKEIYLTDSLGITARYILTSQGFNIDGGGLLSGGGKYIAADFNGDGRDDYMLIPEEGACVLYTAE